MKIIVIKTKKILKEEIIEPSSRFSINQYAKKSARQTIIAPRIHVSINHRSKQSKRQLFVVVNNDQTNAF